MGRDRPALMALLESFHLPLQDHRALFCLLSACLKSLTPMDYNSELPSSPPAGLWGAWLCSSTQGPSPCWNIAVCGSRQLLLVSSVILLSVHYICFLPEPQCNLMYRKPNLPPKKMEVSGWSSERGATSMLFKNIFLAPHILPRFPPSYLILTTRHKGGTAVVIKIISILLQGKTPGRRATDLPACTDLYSRNRNLDPEDLRPCSVLPCSSSHWQSFCVMDSAARKSGSGLVRVEACSAHHSYSVTQ